jgi:hypothetical protein
VREIQFFSYYYYLKFSYPHVLNIFKYYLNFMMALNFEILFIYLFIYLNFLFELKP